jgi:predicted HAD superfamily phosphohydrolase YqeG
MIQKFSSNPILEKKTILLDLDETLIHTEAYIDNKIYDIVIDMAEQGERPDVSTSPP